jgi:hypothetical protein
VGLVSSFGACGVFILQTVMMLTGYPRRRPGQSGREGLHPGRTNSYFNGFYVADFIVQDGVGPF